MPAMRKHRAREPAAQRAPSAVLQTIWDIVAMIPRGSVSTYGEVARAAGLARGARQAGYALRVVPEELRLPWHRVVGAGGRIAFPESSGSFREQVRRLRAEGVRVCGRRVDPAALVSPVER